MAGEANPLQRSLAALRQHLEDKQRAGDRAVWLTPKARKDLRSLPALGWTWSETAGPGASAPAEDPAFAAEAGTPPLPSPGARVREEGPEPGSGDLPALRPAGETAAEKLAWLREKAAHWPPARALDSLREKMVFSVGNPAASLMLVGEAPGAEEERRGEPFVGPAGEKLTEILRAMNLTRGEVYITNIVKFRPAMPNQGHSNRAPTPEEMAACLPFVRAEIDILQPKVIVALGATAARGLLGLTEPVAKIRGRFLEFQGVPVMVTYHPAYLLHQKSGKAEKRKVWEDMLLVMERLGLPISEKQRRYFAS